MRELNQGPSEHFLVELKNVIRDLGRDGGSMTPSVYETAQVLRFCPNLVEVDKVVDWLLRCQQPDGGWGEVGAPLYRPVPTLAAILALRDYRSHERVRQACSAGQRYLEEQDQPIEAADGEYLPVAIELILPRLLDEAEEKGICLSRTRFRHLEELGERKRSLLTQRPPEPDSPAVFSWEAWGEYPDLSLVGPGGVGHNPAATAWWLHLDNERPSSASRQKAVSAIVRASRSAGDGIIGVVPDAWPMNRYEQSFALHMITMAGYITNHQLADALAPQLESLSLALSTHGLGFSDHFAPDGDNTAAAVAVLASANRTVNHEVLTPFERKDHFVAYPFETHRSYTVTARAVQALRIAGCDTTRWRPSIIAAQQSDGWWTSDKWNCSRLYGTCVALAALDESSTGVFAAAADAFIRYQHSDGGWGCLGRSTLVETAFGILSLYRIASVSGRETQCMEAANAAHHYLRRMYDRQRIGTEPTWICKDLNSVRRVDQITILCALLAPYMSPYAPR